MDKANNTHYADTWKILNGADDEIDASLKFDLSEGEWSDIKAYLKANKIAFTLCLISYKDGHSQNSFVWYDDGHIYAVEMNEIGSVTFHVVDNANNGKIKPTDETSSSVLKMLLALENGGANGGGGETTTKQVFKGGVDILDKPLDVESKATFGADVDVDGALTINSVKDLKTKDGTSLGLPSPWGYGAKDGDTPYLGVHRVDGDIYSGFFEADGRVLYGFFSGSDYAGYYNAEINARNPVLFVARQGEVTSMVKLPADFLTKPQEITLGEGGGSIPDFISIVDTEAQKGIAIKNGDCTLSLVNLKISDNLWNAGMQAEIKTGNITSTFFVSPATTPSWNNCGLDFGPAKYLGNSSIDSIKDYGLISLDQEKILEHEDYAQLFYGSIKYNSNDNYEAFMFVPDLKENCLFEYVDKTSSSGVNSRIVVPSDFITKSQVINLGDISDVAKKQATLYRHTITIYEGNTQDGNSICFTTYTPSNTPIDSIQDLTASVDGSNKLANTDLGCFGVSGSASALTLYNKIHVGTNLASTTLQKATGGSVALSSVYSSYKITDDVSLN